MSPALSWLVLVVVLLGVATGVGAIWRQLDEADGAPPDDLIRGWRPLEEEATRVRIRQEPYDQERENR